MVIALGAFVAYGSYFHFGLYLEHVQDRSPLTTGVRLLPQTVLLGLGAAVVAKLGKRHGPHVPMVLAAVVASRVEAPEFDPAASWG